MGRLISEEHDCKRKLTLRIPSHFGNYNLVAKFVWDEYSQKRISELVLGEYLTWLKWEISMWNEQLGAVFEDGVCFVFSQNIRAHKWGYVAHLSLCGAFQPCMNHSGPWRVSLHPKGNRLPHGSFLAIYEELLEKTWSKSHFSPWEQKAWADGGVHSQPWATFETVQSLGASHWCGRAPYTGQPAPTGYIAFCMVLLWQTSNKPAPSPPPVLQVLRPLCRTNIPFPCFGFFRHAELFLEILFLASLSTLSILHCSTLFSLNDILNMPTYPAQLICRPANLLSAPSNLLEKDSA